MKSHFVQLPVDHTAKELHDQALAQKALEDFWTGRTNDSKATQSAHPMPTNQVASPHQTLTNASQAPLAQTNPPGLRISGPRPENKPGVPTAPKAPPAPTHTTVAVVSAKPHHPVRETVGAGALF